MKVLIAGLGFWSAVSLAQSPDPAKQIAEQKQLTVSGVQTAPIGIQDAMTGPTAKVTGLPYSAEAVTERVQTLPDGNRIVQTSSGMVARDSRGRVRRDESLAVALPGGAGDAPKLETIDDPVAGIHWTLDPQLKVASKGTSMSAGKNALFSNMLPPPVPGPEHTWFYSSGAPGSQVVIQRLAKQTAEANTDVSRVDLGTQSMEGIRAQGTRVTRTLPAGSVGNEQPLVITTETWYSPDLKVLVMSKAEDPRMGVTTYRLTNIQRAEPPASLFQAPSDYTIKDRPHTMLFVNKDEQ